jgi:RNA polymerase sigma-70 factor, ECF subfamily
VLHEDLYRALQARPLAFREAVVLANLEGLSYKKVAPVLGCPIGTVMSRLARGRRRLRKALGSFGREHGYVPGDRFGMMCHEFEARLDRAVDRTLF